MKMTGYERVKKAINLDCPERIPMMQAVLPKQHGKRYLVII